MKVVAFLEIFVEPIFIIAQRWNVPEHMNVLTEKTKISVFAVTIQAIKP